MNLRLNENTVLSFEPTGNTIIQYRKKKQSHIGCPIDGIALLFTPMKLCLVLHYKKSNYYPGLEAFLLCHFQL